MERRDEIVVFFAGLVIAEEFLLENFFEEFSRDGAGAGDPGLGTPRGQIKSVIGGASVTIGIGSDPEENVVASFRILVAEAAFFVGHGATKQIDDLRRGERKEDVHLGAREKWRDDFERRIFRGRADEGDVAGFYV